MSSTVKFRLFLAGQGRPGKRKIVCVSLRGSAANYKRLGYGIFIYRRTINVQGTGHKVR